ncbi:c-type cytochrome [Gilvimarinus polysaccharolyticus]|uniref:c-type cytochrome n=1 Tax=Gilvimarinus polysaccharolyticus TaxID=863921 RepID=UPI000673C045|nr:cytochrome c [Gilvimarinus polysaccharolyticus]
MITAFARPLLALLSIALLAGCDKPQGDNGEPIVEDPIALGERKARVCMSCHGPRGVSRVASYPSLAGQPREYLLEQLRDFKSGQRKNPMMNSMVASLSDTDMQHLAAYFAIQGE